ncbi:YraN family protein [Chloroflexota bacterium]
MMTSSRQALGYWGETIAAEYLVNKGYLVIERNLRTSYGEIDLIAKDGKFLVFVEVKTRATDAFGPPEASITRQKKEHLIASARTFLQTFSNSDTNWRIDVIAIRKLKSESTPEIIHFENAIR